MEPEQRETIGNKCEEYEKEFPQKNVIWSVSQLPSMFYAFTCVLTIDAYFREIGGGDKLTDTERQDLSHLLADVCDYFDDFKQLRIDAYNGPKDGYSPIDSNDPEGKTYHDAAIKGVPEFIMDITVIIDFYSYFISKMLPLKKAMKCIKSIRKNIKKAINKDEEESFKLAIEKDGLEGDHGKAIYKSLKDEGVIGANYRMFIQRAFNN